MIKNDFQKTIYACFTGYICQAIVNNFCPLLFLTFHKSFNIPLSSITFLVTMNFGIQLFIDLISVKFVDRLGYRFCMVMAHAFCAVGLFCLAILPRSFAALAAPADFAAGTAAAISHSGVFPLSPYAGIVISVVLYAIGGGLLEVLVSPVMEACPTENKQAAMSLLHSFYCWGHVGVVLISTAFFAIFGISHWYILAAIWALLPLVNGVIFTQVPIASLIAEGESSMPLKKLLSGKLFWILMLAMICAGASEQAVSQWASTLAEMGLGVSKTTGDLLGPMMFAVFMGTSRAIFGKFGPSLPLKRCLILTSVLCMTSYLIISLSPLPFVSLAGCAICGFSVGIMWPGTFSMASAALPSGGTALFALLALAGDVGCSGGPTFAGLMANYFNSDLKKGILSAIIFPVFMFLSIMMLRGKKTQKAD